MENQHRKIKGYRELTQEEIDLMNEIKELGEEVGLMVRRLNGEPGGPTNADQRWVEIGKTHLQQGFMALTRSIAKPESF